MSSGRPNYARSKEYLKEAREFEALIDARPALFFTGYESVYGYPKFISRADGSYIWDVDGNRYIDLLLGYGSVILGHANRRVSDAVVDALRCTGANPTLPSINQIELARRINALVPNAERVTFLKTGSDAVSAAVRLARAVTGKRHVLHWGMHGWHDWCASRASGVLTEVKAYLHKLRYGDVAQIKDFFERFRDDVSCIVMMPYELEPPPRGYFQEIRDLCNQYGALLVLDEVRSGFRVSLGGAQEKFGIDADLIAFAKAMANGHPISALAGKKIWMSQILKLRLTLTYYRGPLEISAALATINELTRIDGPKRLSKIGASIIEGAQRAIDTTGLPAAAGGENATPALTFLYSDEKENEKAKRIFCHSMLRSGVFVNPNHHWFLSTGLSNDDIAHVIWAIEESLRRVKDSCR